MVLNPHPKYKMGVLCWPKIVLVRHYPLCGRCWWQHYAVGVAKIVETRMEVHLLA